MELTLVYITITVGSIALSAVITFFATKYGLKEHTNNKFNDLKDRLHDQELEIEKLKGRDENQQKIIDTFQNQVLDHLPTLYEIVNKKKES